MGDWLRDVFRDRPLWMNALMVFSGFMAFIYVPWDIFIKPVARDQEVWFGIMFSGWGAKWAAVPHGFVYAAAFYGFRRRRPWMRLGGALYSAQVAFSCWVWGVFYLGGLAGWGLGISSAVAFLLLAFAFWNAREYFQAEASSFLERYGEWALVTGASAGIGAEFARALAKRGMSCVLTARREGRLNELAEELRDQYGVATRVVVADLADPEGPSQVCAALGDLEIGVLINNAGVGYARRFDASEEKRLLELVQVNCAAPVALTRRLLPGMCERGKGAIVLVGSAAGRQPIPLHAVYSATKAFDLFLGEALYVEMREQGIDVLVVEPGSTQTEFQKIAGETPHPGDSPARVVDVALENLGRQSSLLVGWSNWIRGTAATRLISRLAAPYFARDYMVRRLPK